MLALDLLETTEGRFQNLRAQRQALSSGKLCFRLSHEFNELLGDVLAIVAHGERCDCGLKLIGRALEKSLLVYERERC